MPAKTQLPLFKEGSPDAIAPRKPYSVLTAHFEDELRARCPLVEIELSEVIRNKFLWKVIEGWMDGKVVARGDRQFWSQARIDFLEQYQVIEDSFAAL